MIKKLLQKIQQNKILFAIAIILGMSLTYPISVYADTNFDAACATLGLDSNNCRLIIQTGKEKGWSDNAIAGCLANMAHEASGSGWYKLEANDSWNKSTPTMSKSYTLSDLPGSRHLNIGLGLIQWSPAAKLSDYADKIISATGCGSIKVTCYTVAFENHGGNKYDSPDSSRIAAKAANDIVQRTYTIPDATGQIFYLMNGLEEGYNVVKPDILKGLNACTTPEAATIYFHDTIEKSGGGETGLSRANDSAQNALAVVLAYDGKTYIPEEIKGPQDDEDGEVTPSGDSKDGYNENEVEYDLDSIYEDLEEKGFITSDQLGAYYKLKEENLHLDDLRRDEFGAIINEDGELTAEEAEQYSENLRQLSQWEANVEGEKITLTKVLRWICMFIGILMIIWVLFLYIAYWFDRINTLVPFSVLSIVSFGHYVVSDNEDTSDVNITNPEKTGKMKQINHKGIIIICLITIIIASFLLSGVLFNWMRYAIMWVQQKLSQLTLG